MPTPAKIDTLDVVHHSNHYSNSLHVCFTMHNKMLVEPNRNISKLNACLTVLGMLCKIVLAECQVQSQPAQQN